MTLSDELVKQFGELMIRAIDWHEYRLKREDEHAEFFLTIERFNLLSEIKNAIKNKIPIVRTRNIELIASIMDDYEKHLQEAKTKDWIKQSEIDTELLEIQKNKR